MAVQFYVESADRPYQSGIANEALPAGVLVHDGGAGVRKLQFADGDYSGLSVHSPEFLSAEEKDEVTDFQYSLDDRVSYQPSEDAAVLRVRTIDDDTSAAPSIGHRTVVGVVDETSVDAPANAEGRLVEEGYAQDGDGDGVSTTFSRANGNFLAVGRAYRPAKQNGDLVTAYDEPVRVVMFEEAKA